jgi:hypothetical protein
MQEAPPPTYTGIGMHAEGSGSDGEAKRMEAPANASAMVQHWVAAWNETLRQETVAGHSVATF